MIRKIICPTDFSNVANNAIRYAANLAQVFNAELLLVHVAPSLLGIPVSEAKNIERELDTRCREIGKLFKIFADYQVESAAGSLSGQIAEARHNKTLVVMGTNGSDTLYKQFFGTNTYRVIRKARCPVFVVPEKAAYRSIANIIFAWNYQEDEKFSFADLHDFTRPLNAEYTFLHVSTHRPESATEVFTAFRHQTESELDKNTEAQFTQVFSHNIPKGVDDYMKKSGADLLALTFFNHKMLHAFFQGGSTKKFINHATYPILVLHS